ncbi:hypothetical protein F6476_01255 [Pseudomonas umsongensis]|jgi:hypothetical protein|uniref:Uncharacterized protein n=1 Tax=Pseudomonas migulae TaxID=78543 RepID=A0A1H5FK64_9PSED|nr:MULTISPECIES: hypothetical protein [Pseudomonas]MBU0520807.1 hypothetical protein [Gammaproteobacteria bacterium]SEB88691.1 hypothetical protein SAMN04490199_3090 [Pseudomonas marginalis]KRP80280.1 hypothetical protein TU80_07985 [Pseudomonas veronii]MBU0844491.1 hypothetical protein [Gammaproteobacteria bacterium]MBU1840223.1 hypothetical protein [Gammaproteobacteria bacterium]
MSVDYFGKYFNDEGFDFTRLLNDDFFQPVRILFNAKHYVSASKLLVVAIDSISYIEYGNIKENTFIKWLKEFSEIKTLGITAEELWEHRNSLLHMSSLSSRKVVDGKERALVAYIGEMHPDVKLDQEKTGYYNLYSLIQVVGSACGKWCLTYDEQREKIDSFVERYDLIASDARMQWIHYDAK